MGDPLFWLGMSLLLVAVSLTAVLVVAIPTLRELSRAARSAEKLFDTLGRELPPTLEAIRLTGLEITELTDDVNEGVQHAGRVVKQVDEGLTSARQQAQSLHTGTRSLLAGARAAWQAWAQTDKSSNSKPLRPNISRSAQAPPTRPPQTVHQPREKTITPTSPTATGPAAATRSEGQASTQPLAPQAEYPHPSSGPADVIPSEPRSQPRPAESDSFNPPETQDFH